MRSAGFPALRLGVGCLLLACGAAAGAAEVVGWRGDGTGRFPKVQPPRSWSRDSNIAWQCELPGGGYASPIVVGDRLFLIAEPARVICVSTENGELLWEAVADYAAVLGPEKGGEIEAEHARLDAERRAVKDRHDTLRKENPEAAELEQLKQQIGDIEAARKKLEERYPREKRGGAGNAAATPVSDGERLYVVFGSGIAAAYTLEGERLWARHLEGPQIGFGHSASPLLAGGRLVVHVRELRGLDPVTGADVWQLDLPAKHGSPVAARIGEEAVVVTPSGALVQAADGRLLAEKLFDLSENSPLVHEGVIYAHEAGKIKAYRLGDSLEAPISEEPLWESSGGREQRMTSAAWHDGLLYCGSRSGILDVTDAATGRSLYRRRMDLGEMFPSIVVAGDLVFVSGREGRTAVLRPGPKYEELATNQLEGFSSTPLFHGDRMYVRTNKKLYCVKE